MVTPHSVPLPLGNIASTSRPGNRPAVRRAVSWHVALVVAMLGFVLRALVPVGFMPDAQAMQVGHIELTLCSPNAPGARAISILLAPDAADASLPSGWSAALPGADSTSPYPLTDKALGHPSDSHADATDCPFALMAAQGVIGSAEIGFVQTAAVHIPHVSLVQGAVLALPVLGPPLGSRAPPAIA
ncbi:hypothetical protein FXN63_21595 [Pigmentiphaga aceris]|uniref:DUF2946 domain-containing protein n=1 Tax=Pigmentiphaga aceris TaxID=1940612 RepID=A0A5C0B1D4_9BURK|nr:hypothetical protein [Pigmentiphaga aceris]QEI08145.1 hypothetical protein FXN63_21595 [Pigmentiphaga aceris]